MIVSLHYIEIPAKEKYKLAHWYMDVFGFEEIRDHLDKTSDPEGPLFLSADKGKSGVCIIESKGHNNPLHSRIRPTFLIDDFCKIYEDRSITEQKEITLFDRLHYVSFFIQDGEGHELEITGHKNIKVKKWLKKNKYIAESFKKTG